MRASATAVSSTSGCSWPTTLPVAILATTLSWMGPVLMAYMSRASSGSSEAAVIRAHDRCQEGIAHGRGDCLEPARQVSFKRAGLRDGTGWHL